MLLVGLTPPEASPSFLLLTSSISAFSHPAQQGEQLAAIANTQTQSVLSPPEAIKLSLGLGVKRNGSSPTFD